MATKTPRRQCATDMEKAMFTEESSIFGYSTHRHSSVEDVELPQVGKN